METYPNAETANELSEEEMRIYQQFRDEFDPEEFEREYYATTEWVPGEILVEQLKRNLEEIRAALKRGSDDLPS